jgi:hypothetical protein
VKVSHQGIIVDKTLMTQMIMINADLFAHDSTFSPFLDKLSGLMSIANKRA